MIDGKYSAEGVFKSDKRKFTENSHELSKLFPSKDLMEAFRNLDIHTSPDAKTELFEDKQKMLVEVLQTNQLPKEILRTHETIYISSGIDIEYPLCLGARMITLVDPALARTDLRKSLMDKVLIYDTDAKTYSNENGETIQFAFDFCEGKEQVTISLKPKIYRKEKTSHHQNDPEDTYTLPENVGMILGYRTQDAFIKDDEVIDHLIKNGVLLVDDQTMAVSEFVDCRNEVPNHFDLTKDQLASAIYKKRGFKRIPLINGKSGWEKNFLIKE